MKWQWSEAELYEFWSLSEAELSLLTNRIGHGRLGFALQLKFFENEGCFPESLKAIPGAVLDYLSKCVGIDTVGIEHYDWNGRTAKRQRAEILSFFGIRRLNVSDRQVLKAWLREDILPLSLSLGQIEERVSEWFKENRLEPLGTKSLDRLIRSEYRSYENVLLEKITVSLSEEMI